jgi:hypothetical protein
LQNQSARAWGRGWAAEEEGGEYAERASSKQPSGVEPTVTHRTIQVLLLNSREIGEGGRGGGRGWGAGERRVHRTAGQRYLCTLP